MRRDHCVLVLIILLAIICWLIGYQEAHAHEIHLTSVEERIRFGSAYDGNKFRTTDDKCWEIYKTPHGDLTSDGKLHIREVPCK